MIGGRVGFEIPIPHDVGLLVAGDSEQYRYPHRTGPFGAGTSCSPGVFGNAAGDEGCVNTIGGQGQTFVPSFDAIERQWDGEAGVGIFDSHLYIVGAYTWQYSNYGYPLMQGLGGGLMKTPDFKAPLSFYGSILYFPQIQGYYTSLAGAQYQLEYRLLKYNAGFDIRVPKSPFFLDAGVIGDDGTNKQNAPTDYTHRAFYGGLGLHF